MGRSGLGSAEPALHGSLLCQAGDGDWAVEGGRVGRGWWCCRLGEQAVEAAGEVAFEAADGCVLGFAFGEFASEVGVGLGSRRARVRAMVCSARLSWRLPAAV